MKQKTFTEINSYIAGKLGDGSVCKGELFSYLKLFQHALSYTILEDNSKLIRNYLTLPHWIHLIILWVRALIYKGPVHVSVREVVVLDNARKAIDGNGESHSYYFGKLIGHLGESSLTIINSTAAIDRSATISVSGIEVRGKFPDKKERAVLKDIRCVLRRCKRSGKFNTVELDHLSSSMHIFYEQFRKYYFLFKGSDAAKCVFITHYHKEGLMAALRLNNVEAIELQHGLISRNDIYYVYPEQYSGALNEALFPDKFLLFGQYWKNLLLTGFEWKPSQLFVSGNLQWIDVAKPKVEIASKENIILLCSQKNLTNVYVEYAKWLQGELNKHPGWKLVVKLHPLEKDIEEYMKLEKWGVSIADVNIPLIDWFRRAKIQVSIYSTTFFDALGYEVVNYSLQNGQSRDYAAEMVGCGVALPLQMTEDPIIMFESGQITQRLGREDIYSSVDPFGIIDQVFRG